ncbi:energy-coupling factor ABC transporter ATP-binding protein [Thermococcus stetteri]|uniref:energy-coupling factor ABC transporter ATP-binding protein n=1 Tax=Thermococcus stetteri TaxID=49900 RepID=UPI001AE8B0ED|nr:ABC transporter ATP-binding protein [Thermococcus stetteri]MBP1912962.1 energy-coupling factor transport system ATP-binding protein [Thermococcus stetteri]
MIEAKNVHFAYNGKEVLRGIDFEMGQEIVALVGPNGSGKTTLAKHFNGLLKPSTGQVLVDGLDTREHTVAELSRLVGYVFQNPEHMFFEESVFNEVAFGPRNLGLTGEEVGERVKWALKSVGLQGFEDRSPYSLSGGEKQRLAIACVLAMKPKYLILDEPTTGLDARAEEEVVNVIRSLHERGHGILLITHDMDLVVRLAERVVLLHKGRKLFDGPVEEFFTAFDVEKYGLERPEVVELGERLGVGFVRSIDEILAKLGGEM